MLPQSHYSWLISALIQQPRCSFQPLLLILEASAPFTTDGINSRRSRGLPRPQLLLIHLRVKPISHRPRLVLLVALAPYAVRQPSPETPPPGSPIFGGGGGQDGAAGARGRGRGGGRGALGAGAGRSRLRREGGDFAAPDVDAGLLVGGEMGPRGGLLCFVFHLVAWLGVGLWEAMTSVRGW